MNKITCGCMHACRSLYNGPMISNIFFLSIFLTEMSKDENNLKTDM